MFLKTVISLLLVIFVFGEEMTDEEEYVMDTIVSYISNGPSGEITAAIDPCPTCDQPVFDDDIWKCGTCEDVDKTKLIYSEQTVVTTSGGTPAEVQVGLAMDEMRCVTVSANETTVVRRVVGACSSPSVTLAVSVTTVTQQIVVNVYGDNNS